MRPLSTLALFMLLVVLSPAIHAQQKEVTATYNHAAMAKVLSDLETQAGVQFLYDPLWIDTLTVTQSITALPVDLALTRILKPTLLNFVIIGQQVVLTYNNPILQGVDISASGETQNKNYSFLREMEAQAETQTVARKVVEVGRKGVNAETGPVTLTGYVRDSKSAEAIPGAYVFTEKPPKGITTNSSGYYNLVLTPGTYDLQIRFTGMIPVKQTVILYSSGELDFRLQEDVISLKEVTVHSERESNIYDVQMGSNSLDIKTIKTVPKVLGENDILKVALTLPGVKSLGEGTGGLSVRGGNPDQNLMLINEAPVYNPNHFLGFFSVFNPDAIKSTELHKSAFPAQYGGRLSSIMDVQLKEGNKNKIAGQGGISPVTAQLLLEIPLQKEKTSLMVGGRSTYSDWILRSLNLESLKNSSAYFADWFVRFSHQFNERNAINATYYSSYDRFKLTNDSTFSYTNRIASLQWRHVFRSKMESFLTGYRSEYQYSISANQSPPQAFQLGFSIAETGGKADFHLYKDRHKIDFGAQLKYYQVNPGQLTPEGNASTVTPKQVAHEQGLENAVYIADNFDLSQRISLYAGIRFSQFAALGPGKAYTYKQGTAKDATTIVDSTTYAAGATMASYAGPEWRLSARITTGPQSSIKISYNRTRQYIHMLSNTVSVSPTNTWKLSDGNIKPQIADQISVGYYRNLFDGGWEASAEVYYKDMQNVIDYKTGSELILNQHIEQDVLQGKGRAYGLELLLRKKQGKVNGWAGYSYSRALIQMAGNTPNETINGGQYFPSNYDRPHTFNVVFNYRFTRRYSLSSNFTYMTGRPITYPVGLYKLGSNYEINYSDRNQYRIPDYIRLDIGFNIEGNHKVQKLAHGFWTISIYNVLGRHNPYSVYFTSSNGVLAGHQLSIFGAPIPTITYNFKF